MTKLSQQDNCLNYSEQEITLYRTFAFTVQALTKSFSIKHETTKSIGYTIKQLVNKLRVPEHFLNIFLLAFNKIRMVHVKHLFLTTSRESLKL